MLRRVLPAARRRVGAAPWASASLGALSGAAAPCPAAAVAAPLTAARHFAAPTAALLASGPPGSWDKFYKCSECQKTFRLQNALNHHIQTKHSGNAKCIVVDAKGDVLSEGGASKPAEAAAKPAAAASAPTPAAKPASGGPAAAPAAPLTGTKPAATAAPEPAEDAAKASAAAKEVFTCTVCQKQFRMEAALQHHYQAKHNMEMPSAAGSTAARAASADDAAARASGSPSAAGGSGAAAEGTVPQPPQYHLDVAPNAPEESEIAAHVRCVNHVLLMGSVQDVQRGFVFEDPVLQFILATEFEDAAPGDPNRDFHTVRVFGEEQCDAVAKLLQEHGVKVGAGPLPPRATAAGAVTAEDEGPPRAVVSGRLRLVPQYEPTTSRYYHFPVVQVHAGSGFVHAV